MIEVSNLDWEALQNHVATLEKDNSVLHQQLTDAINSPSRAHQLHKYVSEAINLVQDLLPEIEMPLPSFPNSLGENFSKFGSDKNDRHSYAPIYSGLIGAKISPHILEVGLGSVNGFPYGGLEPGGSIKAWRATYPNSVIVGADIDIESVNSIDEIGYQVDQTSDESLYEFNGLVSPHGPYDLIVDDGFHEIHANVRTFLALRGLVKKNGFYVVEDIHESLIPLWKVISRALGINGKILDLRQDRPGVDDNVLFVASF